MTQQEMQTEHERAFTERGKLTKQADCLRYRLRTYGNAFATLADEPFREDLREIAERAPDLSADWKELNRILSRIDEINRLLESPI